MQDLHPLIHEGINLHHDPNVDGLDELLGGLSLLPLKLYASATLLLHYEWLPVGVLPRIACATGDAAFTAALVMFPRACIAWSWRALLAVLSCAVICESVVCSGEELRT